MCPQTITLPYTQVQTLPTGFLAQTVNPPGRVAVRPQTITLPSTYAQTLRTGFWRKPYTLPGTKTE